MPFKTMQQLITETERAIYQSAGSAVQIYSQDIIMQHLQDAFDHVFKARWWPRFQVREDRVLDGVTGQVTVAPTSITDYADIKFVFPDTYVTPIPTLPSNYNTASLASGGIPKFMLGTVDSKLFRVYPLDATGNVQIVGRAKPADFTIDDTVPFDHKLLRHYAAWNYFIDDASNPSAASREQGLFEAYFKLVEDSEFDQSVKLDTNANYISDRWTEVG